MSPNPQLQARFDGYIQRQMSADQEVGYLGVLNAAGTQYVFSVPAKPGVYWCRIRNGLSYERAECLVKVALNPYLPVRFRRQDGMLVAYEFVAKDAARALGADAPLLDVPGLPLLDSGSLASGTGYITVQGSTYAVIKVNLTATTDPGSGDDAGDGYAAGSWWLNITSGTIWDCSDASSGAAVWTARGAGPSEVVTAITLLHADGSDPESFSADSSGLDSASAAAASGDVIKLPPGSFSGDHALAAGVEYVGMGREATILSGQITGADGAVLRSLSLTRSASSASALIGLLQDTASETMRCYDCNLSVTNSGTGDAYGVEATAGTVELHECHVTANASGGGEGYGTYAAGGALKVIGGTRAGSTADGQVGVVTPEIPPAGAPAYFEDNGTNQAISTGITSPSGYLYNGVTYVTYFGENWSTYVDAYDHASRTWHGPELVATDPGSFDNHSCPSLIVDDDGYIHVFDGGNQYGTLAMRHFRSSNPEDIGSWTTLSSIGSNTYFHAQVKTSDGTIYTFFNNLDPGTQVDGSHAISSESYATIHTDQTSDSTNNVIYGGNPVYDEPRQRIWRGWTLYSASSGYRLDLFVAYLDLSDGHWYSYDGTDFGTTISRAEAAAHCRVIESTSPSTMQMNIPNLFLDGGGKLHVLWNMQISGNWYHRYLAWEEGVGWSSPENITAAGHQHNLGDLYVNLDGTVDVYLVTNSATYGGDLDHWRRSTGGVWSFVRTIFDYSVYSAPGAHGALYPSVVANDPDGVIRLLFVDDRVGTQVNDLRVYAVDANDAYVIDTPGQGTTLHGVQTETNGGEEPLQGDRAAWDARHYPDLHTNEGDIPTLHNPPPNAAGKIPLSASDGHGGFYWALSDVPTGTLISITGSAPITVDDSDPANPIIEHDASGVAAGTYTGVDLTVDADGHITSISSHPYSGELLVEDGSCAPPVLLTTEDECDYVFAG